MSRVFDARTCTLGEGPLWHPERGQLFWFDIMGRQLLTRETGTNGDGNRAWSFPGHVSAAGWIDRDALLVASETGLHRIDLASGAVDDLAPLEADDRRTRSNDGRADPWGGFWIGTMGKNAEPGLGAIYRFFRGEVRQLFAPIDIPNAIAFHPDGTTATFADTTTGQVMRVRLGRDGWPEGEPRVWLDLRAEGLSPDGAVFDAEGSLWLAEWGAGRVACYGRDGARATTVSFPAPHTTCPAFGGPGLGTLYCTSALQGLDAAARAAAPDSGRTFAAEPEAKGQAEHRVIL